VKNVERNEAPKSPQLHPIYEPSGLFTCPVAQKTIRPMNEPEFLFDEPSAPKAETEKEWIGPRHLTASQAAALSRLADLARLRGQPDRGGITLRNKPLIVGPSGCGKTALVRRLCDLEELPLLVVNSANWVPQGAAISAGPQTLSLIRRFVQTNPVGCVMLDEIDKCCPGKSTFDSSWSLGVFSEILALCDADGKLQTSGWGGEQIGRLREFVVVGAGAWTKHVAKKGESESPGDEGYVNRIVEQAGIPDEILLRFHPQIVEITSPSAKDLALAVRRIRADLSLPALTGEEEARLGEQGARSRHGMRWAEAYLAELLIRSPQSRKEKPTPAKPAPRGTTISRQDANQKMGAMLELLDTLRKPLKELQVKLNLARVIAVNSSEDQRKNFLSPSELNSLLTEIRGVFAGLAYGLSATEDERLRRETQVNVHGHVLVKTLDRWFEDKAFALKSCGALEIAIQVHVMVQRLLETWKFLSKVEATE
jgi:hypothetical protein